MNPHVVLLSIPGLREKDVAAMPNLKELTAGGEMASLVPGFPCVTCPVQAAMTTGKRPRDHGIVANGHYWRDRRRVEMWTSPADSIESPQIWDVLAQHSHELTSAVWFPLHSKGCETDYVCTPAPIHNPDATESLWCYTRPAELYGVLRDRLGHFPLQHYWGPMANVKGTAWIVDSAIYAAQQYRPNFFYIYLPNLDYAAQRTGPDGEAAVRAVAELDEQIGRLAEGLKAAYADVGLVWLVAGEYAITPVDHTAFPNRILRVAGLLKAVDTPEGEMIDFQQSRAFAMVDHQLSHVYVNDADPATIAKVADMFTGMPGIADVLTGQRLAQYDLNHPRCGEVVLVSTPNSWQAYYWWLDDDRAPTFARKVDIHRKPGYDPVELFFDPATKSIPLDASLVRGSHGAPAHHPSQMTVLLCNRPGLFPGTIVRDTDVFDVVLRCFGMK
ncbi:MAG TPA: alkaline phosphatase family protein [Planctomycetaceae bacterium]|nr:alkaline phosphatase family protein [Planctomycetaceae bacterium]